MLYFQAGNFTPNGALSSQGYNLTHCRDSMKNCVKIKSMMFTKIVFSRLLYMSKSVACVARMHRLFLLNLGWFLGRGGKH